METKVTEPVKLVVDVFSIGNVVATISGVLPAIAALVSIIWGCIRIYETETVQSWIERRKK